MTDFSVQTTSTGGSDDRWLASSHGLNTARPGTLDIESVSEVVDSYGNLPSGVGVGIVSATKHFALFDPEATDGTETLVGFTLTPVVTIDALNRSLASGKVAIAVLELGIINPAFLPVPAQRSIDETTASTGQFVFRK